MLLGGAIGKSRFSPPLTPSQSKCPGAGPFRQDTPRFSEFQPKFTPFHADRTLPTRVPPPPEWNSISREGGSPEMRGSFPVGGGTPSPTLRASA
jgi:hypothetical protein